MPEPSNQASLQRRANWVGLRTLRQRPKPVGETPDGEQVYEIRSARLVLRGLSPHFDRLVPCARCGKELPAAPVFTFADLDRPLRPVICTGCVKGTGVSTLWVEPAVAEPAVAQPAVAQPEAPAEPAEPAERAEPEDDRLDLFELHLRAVTDRVNELAKSLWTLRREGDERRREDEAARSALAGVGDQVDAQRSELAAMLSAVTELRAELHGLSHANGDLARAHRDLQQRLDEAPTPAWVSPEDLTPLVAGHEALERRVAEVEARPVAAPPSDDQPEVERLVAGRLAEVEARVADQIAGQWRAMEKAVEATVRIDAEGLGRAHEELAASQAGVVQRFDLLATQLAHASSRMDAMASWVASTNDRLDALEERAERALVAGAPRIEVPRWESPDDVSGESGSLLERLERQLDDAAGRLAAQSNRGLAEEPPRGF